MKKRNVIVVMLDSLSYMYLGCYGNKWIKTPNIDRLAREGVVFENNYIEGLPTPNCRRGMHTGRYHVHRRGWGPIDLEDTTIADLCWGRPIDTAMVYDFAPTRLPKFGYSRGFDKVWFLHGHEMDEEFYKHDALHHLKVEDYFEDHVLQSQAGNRWLKMAVDEVDTFLRHRQYWKTDEDQNVAKVMKTAVRYLEDRDPNKSFFLWVDSFDPHEPWDPPSMYDPELKCPYDPDYRGKDQFQPLLGPASIYTEPELNHIRMLYAEKVSTCDKWVGHLLDRVRELGLWDDTMFLLVSDHGEPLGHGKDGHGMMRKRWTWPYEELAHAPMIMRAPGVPGGKRVASFTQNCDVAPTVTDWLGIGVHPSHQGKSLLPLARGEVDKVRDFAIAGHFNRAWSIQTEEFSYVHWRTPETREKDSEYYSPLGHYHGLVAVGAMPPDKGKTVAETEARLRAESIWADPAMWATLSASGDIPVNDELYERKADLFQLKNIAAKNKSKAAEMFTTLMDFMKGLRES